MIPLPKSLSRQYTHKSKIKTYPRLERDGAENLKHFAEIHGLRVATTLRARGILAENHPLSLGTFGYSGTNQANRAILDHDCDFLLIIGANLSQKDTYNWDPGFFQKKGRF